jgi:tRNA G10  N-methylase Trm11
MRIVADAQRLPLATASVDAVISNPPYPGNGHWDGNWWEGVKGAVAECRRVLRPGGRGWFLLRRFGSEHWAHPGSSEFPAVARPHIINWGTVPDADVAPLILGSSPPGGVVLDPFAGRGGVPKLAGRLGRVPLGADIDAGQLESGGPY